MLVNYLVHPQNSASSICSIFESKEPVQKPKNLNKKIKKERKRSNFACRYKQWMPVKKRNTIIPTLNHCKTMLHQFLKVPYFGGEILSRMLGRGKMAVAPTSDAATREGRRCLCVELCPIFFFFFSRYALTRPDRRQVGPIQKNLQNLIWFRRSRA